MSLIYNTSEPIFAELANYWGITRTGNRRNDIPALYREMTDLWSMRTVLEGISAEEQSILTIILGNQRGWWATEHLLHKLHLDEATFASHLQRLSSRGLIWVFDAHVHNNEVLGPVEPERDIHTSSAEQPIRVAYIPSDLMRPLLTLLANKRQRERTTWTLHELLSRQELRLLQQVATYWKVVKPFGYFKQELIQHIEEAMSQPGAIESILAGLTPLQQKMYRYIFDRGGIAQLADLRRDLACADRVVRDELRTMQDSFLIHESDDPSGHRALVVPLDLIQGHIAMPLRDHAPALQPVPAPLHGHSAEYTLGWDILTILAFIEQNEVSLNQGNYKIPKRLRARMINMLVGNGKNPALNELRFEFIYHCIARLHLIRQRDKVLGISDKGMEWTHLSFADQTARLYRLWRTDDFWREPFQFEVAYFGSTGLTPLRQRIPAWTADAQPGHWYSLDSLQARVQSLDPHIVRPSHQKGQGAARPPTERIGWNQIEARLLNTIFATTLFWLGAVAVDFGNNTTPPPGSDKPEHSAQAAGPSPAAESLQEEPSSSNPPQVCNFSITDLGAWLFGMPDAAQPPDNNGPAILVQPTFEVLVFQPNAALVFLLSRIARLVRADRVAVYQLNRDSLLRTLDTTDLSVATILASLAEASQRDLPQNVVYSFNDWARGYHRIGLSDVTLLEVDDPQIMDELIHKAPDLLVRRLGPTAALIHTSLDEETVIKRLRAEGYFPRWLDPDAELEPTSIQNPHKATAKHPATKKWTAVE